MRVYRYLSEYELRCILQGKFDLIGRTYSKKGTEYDNNHSYRKDVKYLHFFKHKEDLERIQMLYRKNKSKFYFCEFEIPMSILFFHHGKGYYDASGYDIDHDTVTEYAVPVSKMKTEFFKGYKVDLTKLPLEDSQEQ